MDRSAAWPVAAQERNGDALRDTDIVVTATGLGTNSASLSLGVIGDGTTASADKGEKLLAAISADVAEALVNERLWSEPI